MTTRGKRAQVEVEEFILTHAKLKYRPAEIRGLAVRKFGEDRVPTLRTIQRTVRALSREDGDAEWAPTLAPPEEARLVLPVQGAVIDYTNGRIASLTVSEAEWISRVRQMVPDLASGDEDRGIVWEKILPWMLATEYIQRERLNQPTDDIDLYLALAPWRSDEARERYKKLANEDKIPWLDFEDFHAVLAELRQRSEEDPE